MLPTCSGSSSRMIFVGGPAVTFTRTNSSKFWYLKHNSLEPSKPPTNRTPVNTTDPVMVYTQTPRDKGKISLAYTVIQELLKGFKSTHTYCCQDSFFSFSIMALLQKIICHTCLYKRLCAVSHQQIFSFQQDSAPQLLLLYFKVFFFFFKSSVLHTLNRFSAIFLLWQQ